MEITPEIRAIKNAYMKAKDEKNQPEMNRLKSEAQAIMNREVTNTDHEKRTGALAENIIARNEDGDTVEISLVGKKRQTNAR